jgi:hypothetical protein
MTLLTERGIGLEIIQLQAATVLVNEINDEIDRQQDLWTTRDLQWNQLTGQQPMKVMLDMLTQ